MIFEQGFSPLLGISVIFFLKEKGQKGMEKGEKGPKKGQNGLKKGI